MSANSAFELVSERGWRRGLGDLLDNELGRWWKTKMWWIQCLIWVGMIGFLLGAALFGSPDARPRLVDAFALYSIFGGLFPAVGVVIILQDALVGEKRDGTAAWVLSKPAARPSLVLSKLVAHSLGVLATMVVLPGIITYAMIALGLGASLNPWAFLAAMGVLFLNHLFYLTLTLMLGAFFRSRGPVIGIPLGLMFLQQYLFGLLPVLRFLLPWTLVIGLDKPRMAAIVPALLSGEPINSYIPLVALAVECLLFVGIALWRFNREEF